MMGSHEDAADTSKLGSSDSLNSMLAEFEMVGVPQTEPDYCENRYQDSLSNPFARYFRKANQRENETRRIEGRPPLHRQSSQSQRDGDCGQSQSGWSQVNSSQKQYKTGQQDMPALLNPQSAKRWRLSAQQNRGNHQQTGFAKKLSMQESYSLESINTISSGQSSPEENHDVFPLGMPLGTLYRQPSSASLMSDAQIALNYTHEREQRRNTTQNQNPQSESQNWHINQSHTESGSADTVQNQTEAFLAEHQNRLLGETVRSMSHEHESSIFEDQDSDAQSMQNNLSTPRGSYQDSSLAGDETQGEHIPKLESPFKNAAQIKMAYSSSDSTSPKSLSTKSASDYGSFIYSERDGKHVRSHLRKRDYESELLTRLLTSGKKDPAQFHPPTKQQNIQQEVPRGVLGAIGIHKTAFVAVIFMCLAFFLLIFSAGRMHAQKVIMGRAELLQPGANILMSHADVSLGKGQSTNYFGPILAEEGSLPEGILEVENQAEHIGSRGKERRNYTKPDESKTLSDSESGLETGRQHERHSIVQPSPHLMDRKRPFIGLRLLTVSSIQY